MRYQSKENEEKVEMGMADKIEKEYLQEKEQYSWRDRYGKGREDYYDTVRQRVLGRLGRDEGRRWKRN